MRATFTVQGEQLTDAEAYERFVGSEAPGVDVAEAANELTADRLNRMFDPGERYTDDDADEIRAAIRQYIARK